MNADLDARHNSTQEGRTELRVVTLFMIAAAACGCIYAPESTSEPVEKLKDVPKEEGESVASSHPCLSDGVLLASQSSNYLCCKSLNECA